MVRRISCRPWKTLAIHAKLGIDLGGERFIIISFNIILGTRWVWIFQEKWEEHVLHQTMSPLVTWPNIGFGQGLTCTPLQLLAAFGAIANQGIYSVILCKGNS